MQHIETARPTFGAVPSGSVPYTHNQSVRRAHSKQLVVGDCLGGVKTQVMPVMPKLVVFNQKGVTVAKVDQSYY